PSPIRAGCCCLWDSPRTSPGCFRCCGRDGHGRCHVSHDLPVGSVPSCSCSWAVRTPSSATSSSWESSLWKEDTTAPEWSDMLGSGTLSSSSGEPHSCWLLRSRVNAGRDHSSSPASGESDCPLALGCQNSVLEQRGETGGQL